MANQQTDTETWEFDEPHQVDAARRRTRVVSEKEFQDAQSVALATWRKLPENVQAELGPQLKRCSTVEAMVTLLTSALQDA